MRYLQIFSLHFQRTLTYKGLSFVWFLCALVDVSLVIFFWNSATSGNAIAGWTFQQLLSYYLFALVVGQLIMPHQEYDIATNHIQLGGLSGFLLKPFSYIVSLCLAEIPWRIMNGSLAFFTVVAFVIFFKIPLIFIHFSLDLLLVVGILLCAFFIAFLYKMTIGLFAFWIIEVRGVFETLEVIGVILMGSLMPLALFPHWLSSIAYATPFSYIIYFPVIALEGKLSQIQLLQTLGIQIIWIIGIFGMYELLWIKGLKKFSAVGN